MALSDPTLARSFEAAIAWWRAAGVEYDFIDDATAWLADAPCDAADLAMPDIPAPRAGQGDSAANPVRKQFPNVPAPAAAPRNLLGDSPPADLAAFTAWWRDDPGLAPSGAMRVPPRGPAGAALMVLVPHPEEGDRSQLLAGPQGRLLSAMLAAMGLAESEVYITSALPAFLPLADLAAMAREGWDAVLAHHIALAAPRRVLAFGTGLAPMLGSGTAEALREINQGSGKTPVLLSETLDSLMEMPRLKARFWRRWMEWSAP